MFPIGDDNPTLHTPWMTYVILALIFAVWILVQGAGFDERVLAASICNLGLVPAELMHTRPIGFGVPIAHDLACVVDDQSINWLTPITSMFLHGSWGHILGNALFENDVLVAKRRLIHDARQAGVAGPWRFGA